MGIILEKGDKVDFSIPEVQNEAYAGILAGSDTTAIGMRSIFYHLFRSPNIVATLTEEISEASQNSHYQIQQPIPCTAAIKLPLLCATTKEAMRLYASMGFTMPRASPEPSGLTINDMFIAPSYRIGINAYVVQRDANVFGKDSNSLRPSWLMKLSKSS